METETIAFNARKLQAEQAEALRIETERLAEEARQAQIKKDAEERAEKDRQLAELQKENELREKEYHANIKLKDDRFKKRLPQLEKLGFTWDEGRGYFNHPAWGMYWETCVNQDEESWTENINQINQAIKEQAEKDAQQKQRDAELVKEREASAKLAEQLCIQQAEKDKADAEEKQRIEQDAADKLAKEKAALLAPDKEKINQLYKSIQNFSMPEFKSKEALELGRLVAVELDKICKLIKLQSQNLK